MTSMARYWGFGSTKARRPWPKEARDFCEVFRGEDGRFAVFEHAQTHVEFERCGAAGSVDAVEGSGLFPGCVSRTLAGSGRLRCYRRGRRGSFCILGLRANGRSLWCCGGTRRRAIIARRGGSWWWDDWRVRRFVGLEIGLLTG